MPTRITTETPPSTRIVGQPDEDIMPSGRCIGPWLIERLIGAGGMGDVYAVVHTEIGKRAALKVMHRRFAHGLHVERSQIVNRVDHPNIVDIFDSGTVDGRSYLVMPRLEGVTLAHLAAAGPMAPGLAIEILQQMCDALGAAHSANIVHRDLKPDNIFLVSTGAVTPQVKLLDWGIAKVVDDVERRTMQGQLIGTPDYLSPEQACGGTITPATDVYALGVIAYQLFIGCRPLAATTAQDMLTMHVRDAPVRPHLMWPEIPQRLEELLLAMLSKSPDDRPCVTDVARLLSSIGDEVFRSCVPIQIDEPIEVRGDDRQTSGFAPKMMDMSIRTERRDGEPGPRWLAVCVVSLVALVSTSITNIGASDVPAAQVLPRRARVPPPAIVPVPVPAVIPAPPPPAPQVVPPSPIKLPVPMKPARPRVKRAEMIEPGAAVEAATAAPA